MDLSILMYDVYILQQASQSEIGAGYQDGSQQIPGMLQDSEAGEPMTEQHVAFLQQVRSPAHVGFNIC